VDPAKQPVDGVESVNTGVDNLEAIETPAALSEGYNQSSVLIYIIGLITIFVIFGIVAFMIIRKRKQKNEAMEVTPANSIANSNTSDV
jgi:phosphotransferase system  glucose/maltose/N-acetylglucosamine-specific IIC component